MTRFLLKMFLKGEDIRESKVSLRVGKYAGWTGVVLNLILAVAKLVIGGLTSSISIVADAINNAFDTVSSIASIIGFKISAKPADDEHPYGHGRVEYITAVIVSVIVINIGVQFIRFSIDRIVNPTEVKFSLISFCVLVLSVVLKFWFSRFNKVVGKKINSNTLIATAHDSMGDVVTTIVVIIPMLTTLFTKVQVDGYIGVLVSLMIIYNGIVLLKETINPLIGTPPTKEEIKAVEKIVSLEKKIFNIHDIRYESYGKDKAHMSMDVEMPGYMTLRQAHDCVDRVQRQVFEELNIELMIHMEPFGEYSKEEDSVLEKLRFHIKEEGEAVGIYDFRIENRLGKKRGYVDLIVGGGFKNISEMDFYEQTLEKLKEIIDIEWNINIKINFKKFL